MIFIEWSGIGDIMGTSDGTDVIFRAPTEKRCRRARAAPCVDAVPG